MPIDEFEEYGMHRMDADDINQTLSNQSVGVLGLPTKSAPCLRPLSYWFNGDDRLYFVYVLGRDSQKVALSDGGNVARFLVYRMDTTFNWRSILLTGSVERVSADEREAIEERMSISWRPELFERGTGPENTRLYRFQIDDKAGIKQLQRPFIQK